MAPHSLKTMGKFKFRFEVVEKVRKIREDLALRELSEANQKVQQTKSRKIELENQFKIALVDRESAAKIIALQGEIAVHELHVQGLKQKIVQQDAAIFRAIKSFEKVIRKYLQLRKQTQVIEKIRERDMSEFKKGLSQLEQKQIDELVRQFNLRSEERLET